MKNKFLSFPVFLEHAKKKSPARFTYIYYPITYPLSYILYLLGLTPNAVSILGILFSLGGAALVFSGYLVSGLAVFLVSYLFDFCDGNIARIRYRYLGLPRTEESKKLGALLENLYANVSYLFYFFSVGWSISGEMDDSRYFLFFALVIGLKLINRYTVMHMTLINRKTENGMSEAGEQIFGDTLVNKIKYFIVRVIDNARMYYLSALIAILAFPQYFVVFFVTYGAIVLVLNTTKIFLTLIRKLP